MYMTPYDAEEQFLAFVIGLVLLGLGVFLIAMARPRTTDRRRRSSISLTFFAPGYIMALLGAGLAIRFAGIFGPPLWPVFIAIALLPRYFMVSRRTLVLHVMSVLRACTQRNLPLAPCLRAEATASTGRRRSVLSAIADQLEAGEPLSEALRIGCPQAPGSAVALIAEAETVNQMPQAIEAIHEHLEVDQRETHKIQPVNPAYPPVVIAFLVLLLGSLSYYVIPKFAMIFHDMGEQLPGSTRWLLAGSSEVGGYISTAVIIGGLVIPPVWLYCQFRPREPESPHLLSDIGDRLRWFMPGLRRLQWQKAQMQVASFMRLAMRGGATIDQAIDGATRLDVNAVYRRRLIRWRDAVVAGENPAAAAREVGIGPTLSAAFDQQLYPGQAPALLDAVETRARAWYAYALNMVNSIVWPLVILALALLVAAIAYALMMPMIMITQAVTQGATP
jgi:type II secretory pathway component PulF